MSEQEVTMFKLSKTGAILQFTIIAREIEDGAILKTIKGQLGGSMQEDIEPMYPKNVGRANETSPYQQALIMANSKITKLGHKGYKKIDHWEGLHLSELRELLLDIEGTDEWGQMLPQLAQKDTSKIILPGYIQPKYDGMRSIYNPENNRSVWRSRNGVPIFNIEHLTNQLPTLPKGWELDGELYHHDRSLQQIVSMVKRAQPDNLMINFRNYDIIGTGLPEKLRRKELRKIHKDCGPQIYHVPTYYVEDWDEVSELFNQFKASGYEGAMWRNPSGHYECGRRSWHLIKIKDFLEEEFEIIGVEEATGRDAGTAIFICETDEGKPFNVRPMGSREVRREYLENFEENYLGKMLTVRFQNWTDDGIPFHHRGIVVRDYE